MRTAQFPVLKQLNEFDVPASSIPAATFDYLASLEWIRAAENVAECFEIIGGVPKTVLADRMGCLKAGVVANVVVPTADYVRFATQNRSPVRSTGCRVCGSSRGPIGLPKVAEIVMGKSFHDVVKLPTFDLA
jgi:hypothetical protein